jgi:hypothetical protein
MMLNATPDSVKPWARLERLATPVMRLAERESGVPARFIIPVLVASASLLIAVLGMYWDIGYHIDHGRDQNLFTLPHDLIVIGLQGIVAAVLLHAVMPGPRARGERSFFGGRLSLAPGAMQMLACGSIALLGFPLDALWHALFGEDVTLWGPTHLFMIGGAGFSTLGMWMLARQGAELGRPTRVFRSSQVRFAGSLLIGLSTFQAEFDFGVPQFQLLYQPVLIAFAAAVALVCARSLLGPWGAVKVLGMFLIVRGALAVLVGPVIGFTSPHFPLYIVEALVVEGAALVAWKRPLRFALLSGAGIGTVGLAAEWGWSHLWMPHPWTASLLPQALFLALAVALGGAVLGQRVAQALAEPGSARAGLPGLPGVATAFAAVAVLVAIALPLPRATTGDGTRATLVPTAAGPGHVHLAVTVDPPRSARGSEWFEVLSWQGRTESRRITHLHRLADGRYLADAPIPVGGTWKSMLRLARGDHLMALPVYLPAAPEASRSAVPVAVRSGPFTSDTFQLQREARGGAAWVKVIAYSVLAAFVALWLALTAASLRALERARPGQRERERPRARARELAAT